MYRAFHLWWLELHLRLVIEYLEWGRMAEASAHWDAVQVIIRTRDDFLSIDDLMFLAHLIRCGNSNTIQMWTPAALAAALKRFWIDPSVGVTVSGTSVLSITDRFAGLVFSQSTAAQQPTLATDDGTYLSCALSSLICETSITLGQVFTVARFGAGTETTWGYNYPTLIGVRSNTSLRWRGSGSTGSIWQAGGDGNVYTNGAATGVTPALPLPKSVLRATPLGYDTSAQWGVGAGSSTAGAQDWTGRIYEVVCLTTASPDAATIAQIEGYLAWKHGLQSALPSTHAYKTAAPQVTA